MPQRSWGKPFYIRADCRLQVTTRNRDSSRDLGYLLAVDNPTVEASKLIKRAQVQVHVGAIRLYLVSYRRLPLRFG